MYNIFRTIAVALAAVAIMACGGSKSSMKKDVKSVGLSNESDSLAYIIGMSVAEQLYKMDSVINVDVVCRAIMEYSEGKSVMSQDEARTAYLRYLLFVEPERRRGYEERFLADLAESNRDFTRTKSGLTYHIEVIGDESMTPRSTNDWVTLRYSIAAVDGEKIYPTEEESVSEEFATSDLPEGVFEAIKLIGKGGKILAWMPSALLYGEEGSEEYGISPIETTLYNIEIVELERNVASERKREQATF